MRREVARQEVGARVPKLHGSHFARVRPCSVTLKEILPCYLSKAGSQSKSPGGTSYEIVVIIDYTEFELVRDRDFKEKQFFELFPETGVCAEAEA